MKKIAFLFSIALVGLMGCSKDGATGPAGPTGATGATGPAGTSGIKDTIFIVPTSAWGSVSAYQFVNLTDHQITSSIDSTGQVTIFWGTDGKGWDILNWSSVNPVGYTLDYHYSQGTILIAFAGPSGSNNGNPNTVFGGTDCYFRVVCTPSGVIKQHPNTNWKDINQVQAIIDAQKNNKN
ncbi:MAG: hypothetical protein ACLQQ4_17525 [Bacteroidia bacterium]